VPETWRKHEGKFTPFVFNDLKDWTLDCNTLGRRIRMSKYILKEYTEMKRLVMVGLMATTLLSFAPSAKADAIPLCVPGTMASYVALGSGGCQIDDKVFNDFLYFTAGLGGAGLPATEIVVVPDDQPLNPGLLFTAAWIVGAGQFLDSMIIYKVQVLPGGDPITDNTLGMSGLAASGTGIIAIGENKCKGGLWSIDLESGSFGDCSSGEENVVNLFTVFQAGDEPPDQTFDIAVYPAETFIHVIKDIGLSGGTGFAHLSGVSQRFSETPLPEPSSMLLLGAGLLGLVGFSRMKKGTPKV
jgi:hypothetical protein